MERKSRATGIVHPDDSASCLLYSVFDRAGSDGSVGQGYVTQTLRVGWLHFCALLLRYYLYFSYTLSLVRNY